VNKFPGKITLLATGMAIAAQPVRELLHRLLQWKSSGTQPCGAQCCGWWPGLAACAFDHLQGWSRSGHRYIFRVKDGKIVGHGDVILAVPGSPPTTTRCSEIAIPSPMDTVGETFVQVDRRLQWHCHDRSECACWPANPGGH